MFEIDLTETSRDSSLITSYKDAAHFKPETDPKNIRIEIDLYGDEFDTKTGQSSGDLTKMTAIYLSFANIPYKDQCKRSDILLSTLISKRNLIQVTIFNLFQPLIRALRDLNKDPIKFG